MLSFSAMNPLVRRKIAVVSGRTPGLSRRSRFYPNFSAHFWTRKVRLPHTEHSNALPTSWRCPGQPRETLLRACADFQQELGKDCDSNHAMWDVGVNSPVRQSDLDPPADLARHGVGKLSSRFSDPHAIRFRSIAASTSATRNLTALPSLKYGMSPPIRHE
jgi:hypothetical protein